MNHSGVGFHTSKNSQNNASIKEYTNAKFKYTESPHYSAHKTNEKFFKTIDESPFLAAGPKIDEQHNMPTKISRNSKRGQSMMPPASPLKAAIDGMSPSKGSVAELRRLHEHRYREKSPFDSNIEHGLTFMERVVRQKNYQINQRSLALTGRLAIDDHTSVQQT